MSSTPAPPLSLSFSRLNLFAACPLRYRYLEVEGRPEPDVLADWRRAPARAQPLALASSFDRAFGVVVHGALARWQRAVDAGASRTAEGLVAAVRSSASRARLDPDHVERGLARLEPGLRWYAAGPWPRRGTLFLEQPVSHVLTAPDGFVVQLHLRVDRVARFNRGVAIIDFKTVTPHTFELTGDRWQLHTYALTAPELLGVVPERVHLVLVDLQAGAEIMVESTRPELARTADELLDTGRRVAGGDYSLADHPDRPCWSCGFRLECPSSLASASVPPRGR